MSEINYLKRVLEDLSADLNKYDIEIGELEEEIDNTIHILLENDMQKVDYNDITTSYASTGNSQIIDYSVTKDDLVMIDSYTLQSETKTYKGQDIIVEVYRSKKTDALYVISKTNRKKNQPISLKEKEQIVSSMYNSKYLSNNQMAILTFDDNYYNYDISNKKNCTYDFAVVGKGENGKMYAITTDLKNNSTEIVVDDGRTNDTLMTTINGMVLPNRARWTIEVGAKIKVGVKVKDNIGGGQNVIAYNRLVFSNGVKFSAGNEYGTFKMDDEYYQYQYIVGDPAKQVYDQQEYDNNGNPMVDKMVLDRVVYAGNINDLEPYTTVETINEVPTEVTRYKLNGEERPNCVKNKIIVGAVDSTFIPLTIETKSPGYQTAQGTVCYFFEGERDGNATLKHSKDILFFEEYIIKDDEWSKYRSFYYNG